MVRRPARAAALSFEVHPETGIGLDAVLLQEAATEPGVLPLLWLTLEFLYSEDVVNRGGVTLTFETYEKIGGLGGAIAKRADEVMSQLDAPIQAALPRVLRALVTLQDGFSQTVARAAPLALFPEGSNARMLIEQFIMARLVVASSERSTPTVRLAHEALISRWHRAWEQVIADRRDLEIRSTVERQRVRWLNAAAEQRPGLLLRHPDLAGALDLGRRIGDELDDDTRQFIHASLRRHRIHQLSIAACAALIFASGFAGAAVLFITR